jgi:hypothetical protein
VRRRSCGARRCRATSAVATLRWLVWALASVGGVEQTRPMTTVTPFLWFDSGILEAIERYRSVFGDVEVVTRDDFPGARTARPMPRRSSSSSPCSGST